MAVGRPSEAQATPAEVARVLADLESFGAPPAVLAAARARLTPRQADEVFRVHPDNAVAVRVFAAMKTQWTMASLSTMDRAEIRHVGLDYLRLEATARLCRVELGEHDFARLRIMEATALNAWAEARS